MKIAKQRVLKGKFNLFKVKWVNDGTEHYNRAKVIDWIIGDAKGHNITNTLTAKKILGTDIIAYAHNGREKKFINIINNAIKRAVEYTEKNIFDEQTDRIVKRLCVEIAHYIMSLYFLGIIKEPIGLHEYTIAEAITKLVEERKNAK